jgi:hypothetical protein
VSLEQLTMLGAVGLVVLGVMAGVGNAVSSTLVGGSGTATGFDPGLSGPGSSLPGVDLHDGSGIGGTDFALAGDPTLGGGGIGGDEHGFGGPGVGGDESDGTGAGGSGADGAGAAGGGDGGGEADDGGEAGDVGLSTGGLEESDLTRPSMLDECDHPATFAHILRSNWDRVRDAHEPKPGDRIDTEDLEAIAADPSTPADLRAAAEFFLANRAILHVLERGGEGGDDNGRIGRDDLDTAITALESIDWDAFRAGIRPGMTTEEAQALLARFHIIADIADGEGEIDGAVSHDDLRALVEENACLGDGAAAAAENVIENVPEPEECSGFSLCHLGGVADALGGAGEWLGDRWEDVHEIRRGVNDWVGDRIGDLQTLADDGLTWLGDRALEFDGWLAGLADNPWFRYNPAYWAVRGASWQTSHVGIPFTRGAVNATLGMVQGLHQLSGWLQGVTTGDPHTYRQLAEFGELLVTDPGAAWDQAFEIGRAVYNDYKDKVLSCVGSDASVEACSESLGELAPDVIITVLTGGAGKAATTAGTAARFTATHVDDAARAANHLDDIAGAATHADDVAGAASHADDVAATPHLGDLSHAYGPHVPGNPLFGRTSETFARTEVPHLQPLAGDDPLLFRGYDSNVRPEDVFANGLRTRNHPYNIRGSSEYASTTIDPRVAANFATGSHPRVGYVYVIRGRNAVDLRTEIYDIVSDQKRRYIDHEQEWAMHSITPDDVIGAYRVHESSYDGAVFVGPMIPNPAYRVATASSARGREVARAFTDSPATTVVRQPTDDLMELYMQAERAWPQLDNMTRAAAAGTGGEAVVPALKSMESIASKLSVPGHTVDRLTDVARSRVVYDDLDDVYAGLDYIHRNFDVVRVTDRFAHPSPDGYRDIVINVRTPEGHIAEIQLHVRGIHELTESGGHVFYERVREIERLAAAEGRPLTAAERAEIDELSAAARAQYDQAYLDAAE